MLCVVALRVLAVIVQVPPPVTTAVPTVPFTLEINVTVAPTSPVPVKVGVLSFVMLSVLEMPESVPAVRSGVVGAFGGALGRMAAKKLLFGQLRRPDFPELTVDEGRSVLLLDGKRLLRRVAPVCAEYALSELSFVENSGRGVVVLRAIAAP